MKKSCVFGMSLSLLLFSVGVAIAADVGNILSPRDAASDGATDLLYSNHFAAPVAGQVSGVNIFFQGNTTPNAFRFYQLRPTGTANQYTVIYNSGFITPSGVNGTPSTLAFPNGPTSVLPGDIFAHYGIGIPYSDAGGTNATQMTPIYYNAPSAPPAVGNNLTLGAGGFPQNYLYVRDYASNVSMTGFVEQVGLGTSNRTTTDSGAGVLGVLRNDPFTMTATVSKWHIFADPASAGRSITPLLLRQGPAGTYTIIGEGAPKVVGASGFQMFDFDLVAGTANVLAGDLAGWWDGSGSTPNNGVAEFDIAGSLTIPVFIDANGVAPGDSYNIGSAVAVQNRLYSINFTSTQMVPEPATLAVWLVLGALGCIYCLRRRVR
jgi:hypothetical protein